MAGKGPQNSNVTSSDNPLIQKQGPWAQGQNQRLDHADYQTGGRPGAVDRNSMPFGGGKKASDGSPATKGTASGGVEGHTSGGGADSFDTKYSNITSQDNPLGALLNKAKFGSVYEDQNDEDNWQDQGQNQRVGAGGAPIDRNSQPFGGGKQQSPGQGRGRGGGGKPIDPKYSNISSSDNPLAQTSGKTGWGGLYGDDMNYANDEGGGLVNQYQQQVRSGAVDRNSQPFGGGKQQQQQQSDGQGRGISKNTQPIDPKTSNITSQDNPLGQPTNWGSYANNKQGNTNASSNTNTPIDRNSQPFSGPKKVGAQQQSHSTAGRGKSDPKFSNVTSADSPFASGGGW